MQNTSFAHRLTQHAKNTNFFQKTKRQIAGSGLLEKLKFVQWRISETIQQKTDNVNVIRLGALLAALPRMGILAFDFSHGQLAKKFGELYNIPAPSRKSICTWEKELSELGFLKIPQHKASKPKTRVFTETFWELARDRMPKLSYISVPVTWHPTNEDSQVNTTQKLTEKHETKIRADVIDHKKKAQSRAPSQSNKFSRPPKHKTDDNMPKGLDRFENSVAWWLFANKNRGSYRRACILFAEFLRMSDTYDPYYLQLKSAWKECRDSERPGLISDLIRNLSPSLQTGSAYATPIALPVMHSIPNETALAADPEVQKLRIAMIFGGEYCGRYPQLLAEFRRANDEQQEIILKKLEQGWL
jgi:hypothetical protein